MRGGDLLMTKRQRNKKENAVFTHNCGARI